VGGLLEPRISSQPVQHLQKKIMRNSEDEIWNLFWRRFRLRSKEEKDTVMFYLGSVFL
jgi:hypothetical protein